MNTAKYRPALFLLTLSLLLPPALPLAAQTAPAAPQASSQSLTAKTHKGKYSIKPLSVPDIKKGQKPVSASPTASQTLQATSADTATMSLTATASTSTDTTPPSDVVITSATANGLTSVSASWTAATDPESGIMDYVIGVGTVPTGDYSTLANARWWMAVLGQSATVSLTLDPSQTYYVSVYAVNNAGLNGPIVTSGPITPVMPAVGDASNTLSLAFSNTGYDANGNPIAGWTDAQKATMTDFFNKMYPILVSLYGTPAQNYTVTAVRDLRYSNSNEFIPSSDEIRMDDNFNPQLFTHELVHAFRDDYTLTSDANWSYDPTLSGFEESFAQGVSYDAMNQYAKLYPTDPILNGSSLWDSSYDWDYDFENVPELRGTDFWSDSGGTHLYWARYEVGAKAIEKMNIEVPGFYKLFNQEYYRRINANPMTYRPTRQNIVDIIKTIAPTIEGMPADQWVDKQNIFYAQNVYGDKIFHDMQDYPWTEFYAFQHMNFMKTMSCGSEWACWDGSQWVYHSLNGSTGTGKLTDAAGNVIWSGSLLIKPTDNPPVFMGFGTADKGLTTASSLSPWPGGDPNDYVMNLNTMSLYKFESTFYDTAANASTTNSIYRALGRPIAADFSGVWGGVIGHLNGTITLDHDGYAAEPSLTVANGAFYGTRKWTGVPNSRTGYKDSAPGKVRVTFTDTDTGEQYTAERNIGYGNTDGSQMFLFDFSYPGIVASTTVSIATPANGDKVGGNVALTAAASGGGTILRVEYYLNGSMLIGRASTTPYAVTWNAAGLPIGSSQTLTATAYAKNGTSATSAPVTVTIGDTQPPVVSITSPLNGSQVSRGTTVTIKANATDNVAVKQVEFYAGTTLKCTDTTSPYTCNWVAPTSKGVKTTLRARAYDTSGNFADATSTVTTK